MAAAPPLRGVLAAFNPEGDSFALSTGDGRVKTWDVGTGRLGGQFSDVGSTPAGPSDRTPDAAAASNGHLTAQYTALAWGPREAPTGSAQKGKRAGVGKSLIVAGSGSGELVAWDAALGELRWRTVAAHTGAVASITFAPGGGSIFTAGADGQVAEWETRNGELLGKLDAGQHALSAVAVSPDGSRLVAGSSSIKAPVSALAFAGNGRFVLSASSGESTVAMWDTEGRKKAGATTVLNLPHPAVQLAGLDYKGGFAVLALTEQGAGFVWRCDDSGRCLNDEPFQVSVGSSKKGKATTEMLLAARPIAGTAGESGDVDLMVVRGVTAKPHFERVTVGEPGSKAVLPPISKGVLLSSPYVAQPQATTSGANGLVAVLGADNAAEATLLRPALNPTTTSSASQNSSKRSKRGREVEVGEQPEVAVEPENGVLDVVGAESMEEEELDNDGEIEEEGAPRRSELTLGQRLEELAIREPRGNGERQAPPRADSILVLLRQALHANDKMQIEKCLEQSDETIINNTLRELQPAEAARFLSVAVEKFHSRPNRGAELCPWVRAAVLLHAPYLMSAPDAQRTLTDLFAIIDARVKVYKPLLALSGRLDLLMAQIRLRRSSGQPDAMRRADVSAAYVYEESDDEAVAVEDVAGADEDGASDGEQMEDEGWETDEEGGEEDGGEEASEDEEE
eukprot:jgi/Chlat1/8900/Chrsp92S08210